MSDHPQHADPQIMTAMPEVFDGHMTRGQIAEYFGDLAAFSQVLDIMVKDRARSFGSTRVLSLAQAKELVENRMIRAVQLRYRFENREWRDTLLVDGDTYRLVRMKMPEFDR
jgi:hypothetical protein